MKLVNFRTSHNKDVYINPEWVTHIDIVDDRVVAHMTSGVDIRLHIQHGITEVVDKLDGTVA